MWMGPTYRDSLDTQKEDGVFPPCLAGLTGPAGYDLKKLIEYSFARIGARNRGCRVAEAVVSRINAEHSEPRLYGHVKLWVQETGSLRFLQWLICEELGMESSATRAHMESDILNYVTMELTGEEFQVPSTPRYARAG